MGFYLVAVVLQDTTHKIIRSNKTQHIDDVSEIHATSVYTLTLKMEARCISETSATPSATTRCTCIKLYDRISINAKELTSTLLICRKSISRSFADHLPNQLLP
jgi:hypothetical protein